MNGQLVANAGATITPTGSYILSGGGVAIVSGLTFTVSPVTYVIRGTQYQAAQTTLTLATANATYPRYDTLVCDIYGTISAVTGTPAADPLFPVPDPATQLSISTVSVPANATTPPGLASTLIYDEDTGPSAEWTTTTNGGNLVLNSTSNPYHGTHCIEGSTVVAGQYVQFAPSSAIDPTTYGQLVFYIRSMANWYNYSLGMQWQTSGTPQGSIAALMDGTFGFSSTQTTSYQQIVVPMNLFGLTPGGSSNQLLFTGHGTAEPGFDFYLDYVQLQTNSSSVATEAALTVMGNPTGTAAVASAIPLGAGLSFLGGQLVATAALSNTTASGTYLISGGGVGYSGSGLTFNVASASYVIQGQAYVSPATSVTLATADPSHPRYDVIVVDNTSSAYAITGTPAATPIVPTAFPATQLSLDVISVPAAATTPTGVTSYLIYDEDTGPSSEWTVTDVPGSGGTITLNSTAAPYHGSKSIYASSASGNALYIQLNTSTPVNPGSYANLVFYVKSLGSWGTWGLQCSFYDSTYDYLLGNNVWLYDGTYGFDSSNTAAYQQIVIPLSAFMLTPGVLTNQITFWAHGPSGPGISFHLDYVQLQNNTSAPGASSVTSIGNTDGTITVSNPTGAVNLSIGTLPNPGASTLGGVNSLAAVSHNFLTSITTGGLPVAAQPAFTDISGTASAAQLPTTGLTITQHSHVVVAPSGTSGTITLNLANGDFFVPAQCTGNFTLALSNPPSSGYAQVFGVALTQAASGGPYSVTWFQTGASTAITWIGSPYTAPTMPTTAGGVLRAVFEYVSSSVIYGYWLGNSTA